MRRRRDPGTALQLVCAFFGATAGFASANADDKSVYSVHHSTPHNLLRDLTTDRPDLTESPFTVDAGWVQIESNLFGYAGTRDDAEGVHEDVYELATTNVRIGLTHNTEVNVVWQPYGVTVTKPPARGSQRTAQGVGGLELRGKLNVYGNDAFEKAGDTALAVLPFVSFPTDSDNGISPEHVEGGVIVPYAIALPADFGLGLNAGISAIRNGDGSGYHSETFLSAALAYEWTERFGTYYEIAATLGTDDPRGDIYLLGTGFTYALDDNTQLDGGINFGISDAADRWNPFVGLTRRF